MAGFNDVLNRAAGAIGSVVFAVARKSFRAAQGPASRIALDRQIIGRINEWLSNRAADGQYFFFFFFELDVGVFSVQLDGGRAKRQGRTERSFRTRRHDQLTFLSFRAIENVARIATLAQREVGGLIDGESVVAAQAAQETWTFAVRVVTHFQTS